MKKIHIECRCVGKHVPLPTKLLDYNGIKLCPTTYQNIMEYKRMWEALGCEPPGNVRKHFSDYVQSVVKDSMSNV